MKKRLQKFDIIKRNSWLEFIGNVEWITSHAIWHEHYGYCRKLFERKDCQRWASSWVSCSPKYVDYGLCLRSKKSCDSCKMGSQSGSSTDHGNVQVASHGYKAAKELEFPADLWNEANIVEPCSYRLQQWDGLIRSDVVLTWKRQVFQPSIIVWFRLQLLRCTKGVSLLNLMNLSILGIPCHSLTTELTGTDWSCQIWNR